MCFDSMHLMKLQCKAMKELQSMERMHASVCMCMCVSIRVCVCVCARAYMHVYVTNVRAVCQHDEAGGKIQQPVGSSEII